MIPEAYSKTINQLIDKTQEDEIKWEKTFEGSLITTKKDITIEIGEFVNEDEELSYYFFNFRNYKTKNSAGFNVSNMDEDYGKMKKLYTVAEASANNASEELKNFFN